MNAKERVLATIRHEEPDRVPVGEWGIDHDHVSRILGRHTYWRNRKDTTLALWANRRDEVVESLKEDCCRLAEALDYDVVTVDLVPPKSHYVEDPPKQIAEGVWADKRGNVFRYAASNDSIQQVEWAQDAPPFREELTEEDVAAAMAQVQRFDDSRFELLDHVAARFAGERAVLGRDIDVYGHLMAPFHGSYEDDLVLTLTAPDEILKMQEVCLAYNRHVLEHYQKAGVSIAMQGQDFGMNSGCIFVPESIRQLYVPVMQRTNQETLERGMIPFFHCCGNIWEILGDFVAAGYQGYQSIQESAGMDTARVKQLYGDRLTLWTGVQCETLIQATAEETAAEVRRNLRNLMPGGGFIFGSTNSVQYGAKTENYLKALEVVHKEGIYR